MTADVVQFRPCFSASELTALYRRFPNGAVYRGRLSVSFATGDARGRIVSLERDGTWVVWCTGTVIRTGNSLAEVMPACDSPPEPDSADCASSSSN
jgi:hypothetical protein